MEKGSSITHEINKMYKAVKRNAENWASHFTTSELVSLLSLPQRIRQQPIRALEVTGHSKRVSFHPLALASRDSRLRRF